MMPMDPFFTSTEKAKPIPPTEKYLASVRYRSNRFSKRHPTRRRKLNDAEPDSQRGERFPMEAAA